MFHEQDHQGLKRFFTLVSDAKQEDNLMALFECFFTPEELSALSLRVNVVKALLDGKLSQREIAKTLKASISKVTRGSRQLKHISPDLLEKLNHLL